LRHWFGQNPVRVVIDKNLQLPSSLNLLNGKQSTIVLNFSKEEENKNLKFWKMDFKENWLHDFLKRLGQEQINSILVEGGTVLLNAFIQSQNWNEARIFYSRKRIGEGVSAPVMRAGYCMETLQIEDDTLKIYKR